MLYRKLPVYPLASIDHAQPYRPSESGWYRHPLGDDQSFLLYVPEKSSLVQPTLYLALPPDAEPEAFLLTHGWMNALEKSPCNVVFLDQTDKVYFLSVKAALQKRLVVNPYGSALYLVAYGDSVTSASLLAISHPELFAGVAFLGGSDPEPALVKQVSSKLDPEGTRLLSEVPVPAWLSEGLPGLEAYYRQANRKHGCSTLERDDGVPVRVEASDSGSDILPFLLQKRRFPGFRDGNLRSNLNGARLESALVDGMRRYWYVYVPEHVRKHCPLVFVFHGRGGEGGEFISRSGWREVSDREGIITVYPTGARGLDKPVTYWNFYEQGNPDFPFDLDFILWLKERLLGELDVNPERVYLSGQSMGSMVELALALSHPSSFTASASSAGLLPGFMDKLGRIPSGEEGVLPLWVSLGDHDHFVQGTSPDANEAVRWYEETFTRKYATDGEEISREGIFTDHVWRKDGIPVLRYSEVEGKTHAILPGEAFRFYDWLKRWRRRKDGTLLFDGTVVSVR